MSRTFPPPLGELTAISLRAFCSEEGHWHDGVLYRFLPCAAASEVIKCGWLPMLGHAGADEKGVKLGMFCWLCKCPMRLPV